MSRLPDLDLLRSLVIFSKAPSLAEAARILGMTQPTLSYQLKRLEVQSPMPVFTFRGKRKILTHYGLALLDLAQNEIRHMERAYAYLNRRYVDPRQLLLRVGCRRDRFQQAEKCIQFPGMVQFLDMTSGHALSALVRQELDLAVIYYEKPNVPGLVAKNLFTSAMRFVVHRKLLHGYSGKDDANIAAHVACDAHFLKKTPCLRYRENERFITRWFHKVGVDPAEVRYRYTCEDWIAIMHWVEQAHGYALVPSDFPVPRDLVAWQVPLSELPALQFYAVFHQDLKRIPGFAKHLVIKAA